MSGRQHGLGKPGGWWLGPGTVVHLQHLAPSTARPSQLGSPSGLPTLLSPGRQGSPLHPGRLAAQSSGMADGEWDLAALVVLPSQPGQTSAFAEAEARSLPPGQQLQAGPSPWCPASCTVMWAGWLLLDPGSPLPASPRVGWSSLAPADGPACGQLLWDPLKSPSPDLVGCALHGMHPAPAKVMWLDAKRGAAMQGLMPGLAA